MNTLPSNNQASVPDLSSLFDDSSDEGQGLSIDLLSLIWAAWQKRLLLVAIVLVSLACSIPISLIVLEPLWSAQTTILKREQRDEFRVGRYGIPYKPQEYSFGTLLDTLLLPGTLKQAMQRSGVSMPTYQFTRLVNVRIGKESKAFTLSVTWNDPDTAALLTQSLADAFVERNQELRKQEIEKSLQNYTERLSGARLQYDEATHALMSFEARSNIADIDTQLRVLLENKQLVEVRIAESEANVSSKREQIDKLLEQIEGEPQMIVQASYYINPMKKNLTELEWELAQAVGKYTPANPKVIDLEKQVAQLKGVIEEGKDDLSPSNTMADNPIRRDLRLQRYIAKSELLRLDTQLSKQEQTLQRLSEDIKTLSKSRQLHNSLISKRDAASILQQDLQERVDSLKVLGAGSLGDFEIFERAGVPEESKSSGRKLMVIGLTAIAAIVSMFIVILKDLLKKEIRTKKELNLTEEFKLSVDFQRDADSVEIQKFANDLRAHIVRSGQNNLALISLHDSEELLRISEELAINLARHMKSVRLIDADLRSDATPVNILSNRPPVKIDNALLPDLADLPEQGLSVIQFAKTSESVIEQISGNQMSGLYQKLDHDGAVNLYRLPSVHLEESFEALQKIGHAVIVVESRQTGMPELRTFMERLSLHDISCEVAVLTCVPEELQSDGSISVFNDLKKDMLSIVNAVKILSSKAKVAIGRS